MSSRRQQRKQKPALLSANVARGVGEVARQLLTRPNKLVKQPIELAAELAKVVTGNSELAPAKGDRRFNNDTWQTNPIYRGVMQGYLAVQNSTDQWVSDLGLSHHNEERVRLLSGNLVGALSPTNYLAGNPEALKKALDTGGVSLWRGAKNLFDDIVNNGAMPSQVDKSPFTLGENLAATPGQVVYRSEMLELIQYQPSTEQVHQRPLMMVPPQINKFYVYDLSPGRSLIEFAVAQGFQVFAVSWRNPGKQQRHWSFEHYVKALERATEVVCEITGSDDLHLLGACSGGITVTTLVAYLAAQNIQRVNSLSLMVSVLDTGETGDTALGLFAHREVLELARLTSKTTGILEGRKLARVFSWLRPNDLIWSYWVNNYLLGNEPPAFDILFWNSDTTNLSAQLHADFLGLIDNNPMVESGTLDIAGTAIDLKQITADSYVIAGTTDHITPWEACYRTVDLLGGKTEFVLSSSGHIQAIINPPSNKKAKFYTADVPCSDSQAFLDQATEQSGTWWTHWQQWLGARSGDLIPAPEQLGNDEHLPKTAAPGTYVVEGEA